MIQPRKGIMLLVGGLVPLVKRLHFGRLPEWYRHGGPARLGRSRAIARDCLPPYDRGILASLWRKVQFTPTALASRGPPCLP